MQQFILLKAKLETFVAKTDNRKLILSVLGNFPKVYGLLSTWYTFLNFFGIILLLLLC